jgi:hypothetical protein
VNNRLFWNGSELDLSDDTKIGMTYQINNIGELQNRQGNFSNIFKIPITFKNRSILEHLNNVNAGTLVPYKKAVVDYYEYDVIVVDSGVGIVENSDNDYFYLRINSGNVAFFDETLMSQIVGRLYDVSFDDLYNYQTDKTLAFRGLFVQWHVDEVVNNRDGSNFYIFPIVDCKQSSQKMLFDINCQVDKMMLCLFISDIWERYCKSIGWKLKGDFVDSDIFSKLLLTPDNVEYTDEIIAGTQSTIPFDTSWDTHDFYVKIDSTHNVNDEVHIPQGGIGDGEVFVYDYDSPEFYFGKFVIDSGFEPVGLYEDTIGFKGSLSFDYHNHMTINKDNPFIVWVTVPITGYEFFLYNVTTGELLYTENVYEDNNFEDTFFDGSFTIDGVFYPEHKYKFVHRFRLQERGQDGWTGVFGSTITHNSTSFANEQVYGGVMFFNQLFNIKTKDVFKDVMRQFGVICQANSLKKEIYFNYLDTILSNIHLAENWSNDIDTRSIQLYFTVGNYTNTNLFKYKENDFVTLGYGDGTLTIDVADIDIESTQIEMVTSATESYTAEYEEILVPQIKLYEDDWTPNEINNRILILDVQDTAYDLDFTDGNTTETLNTNIPFARFTDPTKIENLDFDSLINNHYKLIQGVLSKPKRVNVYKKFTPMEIKNLDFMIPVYLDVQHDDVHIQGLFYKNKIENYKGGLTKIELIRL